MPNFYAFFLVFIGGGCGSVLRFGIGFAMQPIQLRFPWATLLANVTACFVIGVLTGLTLNGSISDQRRLLLATGFCGGLSTFSTFTAETWRLFYEGQSWEAFGNIVLSLTLCFGCLLLGLKITA